MSVHATGSDPDKHLQSHRCFQDNRMPKKLWKLVISRDFTCPRWKATATIGTHSLLGPERPYGSRIYKYPKKGENLHQSLSIPRQISQTKKQLRKLGYTSFRSHSISYYLLLFLLITFIIIHVCLLVLKTPHQTSPWLPQETLSENFKVKQGNKCSQKNPGIFRERYFVLKSRNPQCPPR